MMGDRFANGDPSNDEGGLTGDKNVTGFDPTGKGYYNGGDLQGLRSRLDYIEGLGTDAIWLTPIFKNKPVQLEDGPSAGYHGYWITDFTQVDPHLGTNADLTALVEDAHDRGMKVFFDIITNHTADVIGYEEGARTAYVSKDASPYETADGTPFDDRDYAGTSTFPTLDPATSFPYTPVLDPTEEGVKVPAWLNDPTMYHNRGNTTFTGEDSQYGDFFGLDDLFTERPEVVAGMTDIYRTWVEDFDIDGFRIDTMKHVNDEFWQSLRPAAAGHRQRDGNPDFFMFGEVALDGSERRLEGLHLALHDPRQDAVDPRLPLPGRRPRLRVPKASDNQRLAQFFRNDDWYTDHELQRLRAADLPRQPRHGPVRLLPQDRQPRRGRAGAPRPRPARPPADVPLPRQPGRLLRRRAGFHRHRRRPARPADDVRQPGAGLHRRRADRLGPHRRRRQLRHRQRDVHLDHRRAGAVTDEHPALRNGAMQVRSASTGPGVFAFSRIDRPAPPGVRRRAQQQRPGRDQEGVDVPPRRQRAQGLRHRRHLQKVDRQGRVAIRVPALSTVVYRSTAPDGAIGQGAPDQPRPAGTVGGLPRPDAGACRRAAAPRSTR